MKYSEKLVSLSWQNSIVRWRKRTMKLQPIYPIQFLFWRKQIATYQRNFVSFACPHFCLCGTLCKIFVVLKLTTNFRFTNRIFNCSHSLVNLSSRISSEAVQKSTTGASHFSWHEGSLVRIRLVIIYPDDSDHFGTLIKHLALLQTFVNNVLN